MKLTASSLKIQVIEVISYSRFYQILEPMDCIALHQWAQQHIVPKARLKAKFKEVLSRIKKEGWQRPEFQYNSQLRLMYRSKLMSNFKEVPNQE